VKPGYVPALINKVRFRFLFHIFLDQWCTEHCLPSYCARLWKFQMFPTDFHFTISRCLPRPTRLQVASFLALHFSDMNAVKASNFSYSNSSEISL